MGISLLVTQDRYVRAQPCFLKTLIKWVLWWLDDFDHYHEEETFPLINSTLIMGFWPWSLEGTISSIVFWMWSSWTAQMYENAYFPELIPNWWEAYFVCPKANSQGTSLVRISSKSLKFVSLDRNQNLELQVLNGVLSVHKSLFVWISRVWYFKNWNEILWTSPSLL